MEHQGNPKNCILSETPVSFYPFSRYPHFSHLSWEVLSHYFFFSHSLVHIMNKPLTAVNSWILVFMLSRGKSPPNFTGKSQKFCLGLPPWLAGSQAPWSSAAFLGTITGSWTRSRVAQSGTNTLMWEKGIINRGLNHCDMSPFYTSFFKIYLFI